nr:variable surface lipoprotein [Mycoplasmopsis bovis]
MKRKLMLIGGGLVFASSFPMIAASCENKNPTDESIVNNTTPQTQDNQKSKDKKEKEQKILMVLVIHLRILPHKLKVIKTEQKHKSKENVSIKTDPTNSKTVHQQQENPTRLKVDLFTGCNNTN